MCCSGSTTRCPAGCLVSHSSTVDVERKPLRAAIFYDDDRSEDELDEFDNFYLEEALS